MATVSVSLTTNMYVWSNANQLINVFQIKLGHTVVGANVKLLKYY